MDRWHIRAALTRVGLERESSNACAVYDGSSTRSNIDELCNVCFVIASYRTNRFAGLDCSFANVDRETAQTETISTAADGEAFRVVEEICFQ